LKPILEKSFRLKRGPQMMVKRDEVSHQWKKRNNVKEKRPYIYFQVVGDLIPNIIILFYV